MERRYVSEGAKCGGCGSDLGSHEVWSLVFSDDDPELVQRVVSGKINFLKCNVCDFDGGWLYPPFFTYVNVPEERAVAITPAKTAVQQVGFLRQTFDNDEMRRRGLDPERLLLRTKIAYDYRNISEALEIPVEQVERENAAILRYLERRNLTGRARIEHLIQSSLDPAVISLEAEEYTPEFLEEIEQYRKTLTGDEDYRVPQLLDQLADQLAKSLVRARKKLPRRDEMSALAQVFKAGTEKPKDFLKFSFDSHVEQAKADVIQLRLLRLCRLRLESRLTESAAAPIDFRPELTALIDQLIAGEGFEDTVLSERDRRVLPEVKNFLEALPQDISNQGLREPDGTIIDSPLPAWLDLGLEVLNELYKATETAIASSDILNRLDGFPLGKAYVKLELGERLRGQGKLSGAMENLSDALGILKGSFRHSGDAEDNVIGILYGTCLERIGRLLQQYGRFEDAIQAFESGRSIYEEIGAREGVYRTLRHEGPIWLELGQPERAEQMFKHVVRESEGGGRTDEVRDLLSLSDVYRRLPPWAEAQLRFVSEESAQAQPGEVAITSIPVDQAVDNEDIPFEKMGGAIVFVSVEDQDELSFRDLIGNESQRLMYRALAVAIMNGDAGLERTVTGRLINVYAEKECKSIASAILDRMLERWPLEKAGLDAQFFAFKRLGELAASQEEAGDDQLFTSTRTEQLELLEFILTQADQLLPLVNAQLRGEKACLLESLDRADDARAQYLLTIKQLEHSRFWMRDPGNKRALQSRRWHPYVRAARNSLRIYSKDQSQAELLIEAWYYIQQGRSRALLDVIADDEQGEMDAGGVASVRPLQFNEVSACLPKDLAVLEYVLMPSSSGCPGSWALFVVEPDSDKPWLAWQEPDMERVWEAQQKLVAVANEYERTIVQYGLEAVSHDIEHRYISALEELADILLPSRLLEKLGAAGYQRLVIVPDAYLQEVPFAALRPKENDRRGYLGLPTELNGFQLIYAPSASIFAHWVTRVSVANVTVAQRAALFIDPLGDLMENNAAVVPTFAEIEFHLRTRQIQVTRLDGKAATPTAWLTETPACNLVIYFGHSIAGPAEVEPALLLNDGAGIPAFITADTIYREATRDLFSDSSLFIFGSCSGGFASAGMWDSDRELRGLSVAHLYAGCAAVIGASRPLLDSPTLLFLHALMSEIVEGHDAVTCLTKAQKKMAALRNTYAHPHFWGYVGLMGAPDWRFSLINRSD